MLIRSVVPSPSRTSSTRPPASARRGGGRRRARPDRGSPAGSTGRPGCRGRWAATRPAAAGRPTPRRGVGCRSANGRMTASACSKRSKLANRPCQSWRGSRATVARAMMPGRAVVVQVQLGVVALDVDELGVGAGVDDVEGPHEPAAAVHHAVLDRARAARAAGQEPADRRAGRRRVHQDLLAGGVGGPLQLDERRPGVGRERRRRRPRGSCGRGTCRGRGRRPSGSPGRSCRCPCPAA